MPKDPLTKPVPAQEPVAPKPPAKEPPPEPPKETTPPEEFGGQKGLEPTRYGDWENKGRCTDF